MNNDLKQLAEQVLDATSRIADEQAFVKDLYKQAKASGYDVKILKRAIALISKDGVAKAGEELKVLDTYLDNLGQMRLL